MQQIVSRSAPNRDGKLIANISDSQSIIDSQTSSQQSTWLMAVAQDRDKQAFTALFEFFSPKIKGFGVQRLGSQEKASELVQETMTNVWRKAHLYDVDKGAATTWVYTIMRNACFDMLRRIKAKNEQNLGDDIWAIDDQLIDDNQDDTANFSDHLMEQQMQRYINSLPSAQQTVVKGVYFQELSQEQLAQQLGVPLGTIKSRLRLALAKLKQQMGDEHHD